MRYTWSLEVFGMEAAEAARVCALRVADFLETQFAQPILANLDLTLRYVPIIMPPDMRENYSERSRIRLKQRLYDCAPQLDLAAFLSDDTGAKYREFVRGLKTSLPELARLGANTAQIAAIENAFDQASKILATR
jgi:hypothetical protein